MRQTRSRVAILEEFLRYDFALSQPDLEKSLGTDFDRVTLYRTLTLFLEKGILHKVPGDEGATKYALCPDECNEEDHQHDHVHFKCSSCGQTLCMDDLKAPQYVLPNGYLLESTNLLIEGLCPQCN